MELFVIVGILIGLTWLCSAPKKPESTRDTLNESCPNRGTGDLDYYSTSYVEHNNELKF